MPKEHEDRKTVVKGSEPVEKSPLSISRRDLFKGTAALGTGLLVGTAAGRAWEAKANAKASPVNVDSAWYVRTVSKPTTPYNLFRTKRYNQRESSLWGPGLANYAGQDKAAEVMRRARERLEEGIRKGTPGLTLWDRALADGAGTLSAFGAQLLKSTPIAAQSPAERGLPGYDQPPEVAAKHVKQAARFYGAAQVGITALRHEWTYEVGGDGRRIVFADVDQPVEEKDRRIFPNKVKNMIIILIPQPFDASARHQSALFAAARRTAYNLGPYYTLVNLAEFIRSLGYIAIPCVNNTFINIPHAIEAGLGELGRHNRMVSPHYGANFRIFPLATDMPLAHDRPIDFGLIEFCRSCMKCAEMCPAEALSFEPEPTWEIRGPWNNPGHKAWFEDSVKCREVMMVEECGICQTICTYGKKEKTLLQNASEGVVAATPAFNGMLAWFDYLFGYGQSEEATAFWDLDLPLFGIYQK